MTGDGNHGFVACIMRDVNVNYFTGCGFTALINDAKVFRTAKGANEALSYWRREAGQHFPHKWFFTREVVQVSLVLA